MRHAISLIRRFVVMRLPPQGSTQGCSAAASEVYKRQGDGDVLELAGGLGAARVDHDDAAAAAGDLSLLHLSRPPRQAEKSVGVLFF